MRKGFYKANLSHVPNSIIDSTLLSIKSHQKRYSVGVPYKWQTGGWTDLENKKACISNMKHVTTDEKIQQFPELYFENIMIPYVYPEIDKWIVENKPEYVGEIFHTRSSWYMIYGTETDTYTPMHNHAGQGQRTHGGNQVECCSGCFYLQSPGNHTRTFEFYDDNGELVKIYPADKDLVLFPTDMMHSAHQQRTNMESIAIAFNVLFYKENDDGTNSKTQ